MKTPPTPKLFLHVPTHVDLILLLPALPMEEGARTCGLPPEAAGDKEAECLLELPQGASPAETSALVPLTSGV